jgi:hypothetical protein
MHVYSLGACKWELWGSRWKHKELNLKDRTPQKSRLLTIDSLPLHDLMFYYNNSWKSVYIHVFETFLVEDKVWRVLRSHYIMNVRWKPPDTLKTMEKLTPHWRWSSFPWKGFKEVILRPIFHGLRCQWVCEYSGLSQFPFVLWASGHWQYERTLYSRRPWKGPEFLSIYLSIPVHTSSLFKFCLSF